MHPWATRVQGVALVSYFALLPYVVILKWRLTSAQGDGPYIRSLLVVLALFWLGFLFQVVRNVRHLKQGRRVNAGGSAWLAGLVVALLTIAVPTSPVVPKTPTALSIAYHDAAPAPLRTPSHAPSSLVDLSAVPLALMAKRRSDVLRRHDDSESFDVDESVELLRARNPELIGHLGQLIGERLDGVLNVRECAALQRTSSLHRALVACALGPSSQGWLVGFAGEGGKLPIHPSWSAEEIISHVVSLHEGAVLFARNEFELLRGLATRALRQSIVVYLGAASDLDQELVSSAVTLRPYLDEISPFEPLHLANSPQPPSSSDVRVEVLRADPQVVGVLEPFTPTLRRRCIEMVAYLALHRHEPITGERLRTRVLTHADVDASTRTLANTASAVRRSLGVDARGPRLHPVTSSGLYVTHGVFSDLEVFSTLVTRARQLELDDAAPLVHQALLLIKGEPLASALRGFEWFLAEGHGARLARDGEWAALTLHHCSLQRRNYELAFWALQQGLLIDPYNDALSKVLSQVPRLREFGSDGASRLQDEPVRAHDAVAMSWSFASFTQQVSK